MSTSGVGLVLKQAWNISFHGGDLNRLQVKQTHSHSQKSGHHGTEAVEQEAVGQQQEVVHEGCDGEDERELFVLLAAVYWTGRHESECGQCVSVWSVCGPYVFTCLPKQCAACILICLLKSAKQRTV